VIKTDPIVGYVVRGLAPGRSEVLTYSTALPGGRSIVLRNLAAQQTAQEEFVYEVAHRAPFATLASISMSRDPVYLSDRSAVALDNLGLSGLLSNGTPAPPSILKLVEWTSQRSDVATVRNGTLTTHKRGSTTITAEAGAITLRVRVVVGTSSSAIGATSVPPSSPIPGLTRRPKACAPTLANQLVATGSATQLITVDSPSYRSTTATLRAWKLADGCWQPVFGPWVARVGTTGVWDHKTEGDGTTPTGLFGIGPTIYGIDPNPGVSFAYHQLVCGDWWDEDPTSADYNTFQHVPCDTAPPFGGNSEDLRSNSPAYDYLAVIDYNMNPVIPGAGSAIFLHVDTGSPTAGCVSIPAGELTALLDWLSPTASPAIVIGTDAEIRAF
jgi:L,D-peptidoglycan transpeptidase YkuD (ErfK/YbiS/YcfS/YnhG family)